MGTGRDRLITQNGYRKGQIDYTGWVQEGTDCFHRMRSGRDRLITQDGYRKGPIDYTGWVQEGTD